MANAKGARVRLTLACTECKQRNYDKKKNKKNTTDRLELNKYCRFCRPVKSGKRAAMLQRAVESNHTSIFYESPFRIVKTIQALAELAPDTPVCVARELTKVFETYHRGSAATLLAEFTAHPPKGEMA